MKKILCLLLSVMLLISLCGCQNREDNLSSNAEEVIVEEIVQTQSGNNQNSQYITNSTIENSSNISNNGSVLDNSNDNAVSNNEINGSNVDNSNIASSIEPTVPNSNNNVASNTQSTNTNTSSTNSGSQSTSNSGVYMLNDSNVLKNIKLNGRCDKLPEGISLGLSASAIEFNTNSTAVMLVANCADGVYYTIEIDGQITQKHVAATSGTNYIIVARGLSKGTHNVKIIRDGEGKPNMHFTAVNLQLDDGELLDREEDKTLIEFLGDSLTSGCGNLIINGMPNPYELKNQSATSAYPYLVASKLGLDYRIVSQSGIALGKRDGYESFPDYYNIENYYLDKEKKYTSSNPQDVDIVVVNLGTNDMASGMYNTKDIQQVRLYEKNYANLIKTIGYRKDAKIVFVSGVWYNDPAISDGGVVKELQALGYNNVYTLPFVKQYKSGGDSHPSEKEHQEIADAIINLFKVNGIA